jgi:predicted ATPase
LLLSDLMKRVGPAHPGVVPEIVPVNCWVMSPAHFALVQHALGRPDEALKLSDEALRRGRQLKHPYTLAAAFGNVAVLRYRRREPEAARELAEAQIAPAEEHGLRERIVHGRLLRGWAMTELGQPEQGLAELEAPAPLAAGWVPVSGMLGEAYMRAGRADRALVTLDEALARSEQSGAHGEEPELHRLRGEAILACSSTASAEAEACFRKAIEIARSQSARWWELRATVSLARLLRDTGRRDEARSMLAEIYNWFTEGFDTADLKEAKALLDELGGEAASRP